MSDRNRAFRLSHQQVGRGLLTSSALGLTTKLGTRCPPSSTPGGAGTALGRQPVNRWWGFSTAKSGKLGFMAAKPIPQLLRSVNRFTLGACSINPQATLLVIFSGDWFVPTNLTAKTLNLVFCQTLILG